MEVVVLVELVVAASEGVGDYFSRDCKFGWWGGSTDCDETLGVVGARVRLIHANLRKRNLRAISSSFPEDSTNSQPIKPLCLPYRLCAILHSPHKHVLRHTCMGIHCTSFECA